MHITSDWQWQQHYTCVIALLSGNNFVRCVSATGSLQLWYFSLQHNPSMSPGCLHPDGHIAWFHSFWWRISKIRRICYWVPLLFQMDLSCITLCITSTICLLCLCTVPGLHSDVIHLWANDLLLNAPGHDWATEVELNCRTAWLSNQDLQHVWKKNAHRDSSCCWV